MGGFVGGLLLSICGIIWLASARRTDSCEPKREGSLRGSLTGSLTGHVVPIEALDEVLRQSVGGEIHLLAGESLLPAYRDYNHIRDASLLGATASLGGGSGALHESCSGSEEKELYEPYSRRRTSTIESAL